MAQTIADIPITPTWQSLNTLSGIPVGAAMQINNKTITLVILAEGTQPLADSTDGVPLTTYRDTKSGKVVPAGSLEIWARTDANVASGLITVQSI